jgi:hypothetical protein
VTLWAHFLGEIVERFEEGRQTSIGASAGERPLSPGALVTADLHAVGRRLH